MLCLRIALLFGFCLLNALVSRVWLCRADDSGFLNSLVDWLRVLLSFVGLLVLVGFGLLVGLGVALLVRCLLWYVCFSDFGWFWLAVLVFMFWCCGLWVVWVSAAVVLTVVICCFRVCIWWIVCSGILVWCVCAYTRFGLRLGWVRLKLVVVCCWGLVCLLILVSSL